MAFAVLLLICVLSPWELSGFWPVTRDYFPQSVALCAAAFAALMLALAPANFSTKFSPLTWCLVGFIACNLLALITAVYRDDALLELARLTGVLAWFFIARRLLSLPENERVFARATLIVMALIIGRFIGVRAGDCRIFAERAPISHFDVLQRQFIRQLCRACAAAVRVRRVRAATLSAI